MSTLESTFSMLEILPESDIQYVFNITKELLEKRKASAFNPVSKQEVLEDLEISTQQIENGQYYTGDDVLHQLRDKYGL